MFRLNPDSQSHKFVRTDRGDDRLQAVVSACRTAFANANLSERQSQVVGNHHELLDWRLAVEFRQQTGNCLATQVHEGLRFRKLRNRAFDRPTTYE